MTEFTFGSSPSIREVERKIARVAGVPIPVLLEGEPSTGKETLAMHLHTMARTGERFTRFACSTSARIREWDDGANCRGWVFLKNVDRLSSAGQEELMEYLESTSGETGWSRVLSSSSSALE